MSEVKPHNLVVEMDVIVENQEKTLSKCNTRHCNDDEKRHNIAMLIVTRNALTLLLLLITHTLVRFSKHPNRTVNG